MSYQPPVIGGKQLLNFHATSWPGIGGWITILAVGAVVTVALLEWRRVRRPAPMPVARPHSVLA
jgi:copper chaperone NosL